MTEVSLIGRRLGPYEILERLGAGGMGEVYRAHDSRLQREVAVKVLSAEWAGDEDRLRRFEAEARAVGLLNHPNLLTVHDLGRQDDLFFLVTELLEGETLAVRLQSGPLPASKAIDFARQLASGLATAHERGVIHRDLKPANLFVTGDGRIKILDFGVAKVRDDATPDDRTLDGGTTTGTMIGTVGYMAPEQVRGQQVDQRADIFALGAVLHEMLCGRRAFQGDTPADTLMALLGGDPEPLDERQVPPALCRIVRRCLEKEPGERFSGARDLGYALEAVREGSEESVAVAGRVRSLAVLLFRDLAGGAENAHLGIGLADALVSELAQVETLTVRPTAASLRYREVSREPREIGRELAVETVVDGSFQRAGEQLRITAQLVDVAGVQPVWATKLDGTAEEIFDLQDRLARRLREALRLEEPAPRGGAVGRPAGRAYELYLKGRLKLSSETRADTQAAIEWFEQALAADGDFALAWAGLADAYSRMAFTFDPEGDWYARAEDGCRRALEVEPELPEGHYVRARLVWCPRGGWDHATGLRELAAALLGRPSLNEGLERVGTLLFHVGMLDEAERFLRRALEIDPKDAIAAVHLGSCLYFEGDWAGCLRVTEEVARRAPSAWAHGKMARSRIQLGDLEAAEKVIRNAATLFPDCVYFHTVPGLIAAKRGDRAEAVRRVEQAAGFGRYGHYHHAQHDVAAVWAQLGEIEPALEWLEEAATNGFPCATAFRRDPLLAPLRGEERFEGLMARLDDECRQYRRLFEQLFDGTEPRRERQESGEVPLGPPPGSLAVLPFADLSPLEDQDYFCDGLTEELINTLTRIDGVSVASLTSSFRFRASERDIRDIGRDLSVARVLEGSVRRSGERLRISARLIDVASGYQLWSERFDRRLDDVFAVQEEIAMATLGALRVVLSESERRGLLAQPTADFRAYDYYLRGRQYFYRGGHGYIVSARRMFNRAIEIDPECAVAHAGLADCSSFIYLYYEPSTENLAAADSASRRAVELEPELAEAHVARGLALALVDEDDDAHDAFRRAIALNPRLFEARYLFGRVLFAEGRFERAAEELEGAVRVRPEEFQALMLLAKTWRALGREEAARESSARALTLAEHHLELEPNHLRALCVAACSRVELGDVAEGLELAARARRIGPQDAMHYYLVCCYARAGNPKMALDCLEECVDVGWAHREWLERDPDLESLRGAGRFQTLMSELAGS